MSKNAGIKLTCEVNRLFSRELSIYCVDYILYILAVNTKTREHGSQSSRKLKMAPVR